MERPTLSIQRLTDLAVVPEYQSSEAAGLDLHAAIDAHVVLEPGEVVPDSVRATLQRAVHVRVEHAKLSVRRRRRRTERMQKVEHSSTARSRLAMRGVCFPAPEL